MAALVVAEEAGVDEIDSGELGVGGGKEGI